MTLAPRACGQVQSPWMVVDGDDLSRPHQRRRLQREQAHRAAAPDRHRVTGADLALLVRQVVGHDDGTHVREGHPDMFRLPAGIAARQVAVAEDPARRMAEGGLACVLLFHRVGIVAGRVEPFGAEAAAPQEMVKGTTTRWPCFRVRAGPVSTTRPMNSWPRISPCSIPGITPSKICNSEPQIAIEVSSMIASREPTLPFADISAPCAGPGGELAGAGIFRQPFSRRWTCAGPVGRKPVGFSALIE